MRDLIRELGFLLGVIIVVPGVFLIALQISNLGIRGVMSSVLINPALTFLVIFVYGVLLLIPVRYIKRNIVTLSVFVAAAGVFLWRAGEGIRIILGSSGELEWLVVLIVISVIITGWNLLVIIKEWRTSRGWTPPHRH